MWSRRTLRLIGMFVAPALGGKEEMNLRHSRHFLRTLLACLCLLATASPCLADETCRVTLSAAEAFQQGQGAWDVRLHDGGTVGLYDRVLIEDDGPGIGGDADWLKTDLSPVTEISDGMRVKKVLHVPRCQTNEARLCAPTGVTVELNGRPVDQGDVSVGMAFFPVPGGLLKGGDNDVVLYCRNGQRRRISPQRDRADRSRRRQRPLEAGRRAVPPEIDHRRDEMALRHILHQVQADLVLPVHRLPGLAAVAAGEAAPGAVLAVRRVAEDVGRRGVADAAALAVAAI